MEDCDKLRDGKCEETGRGCDDCEEVIDGMGGETIELRMTEELFNAVQWGFHRAQEHSFSVFARSVLGGAFISFGCLMSMLVRSDPTLPQAVSAILSGVCFSFGLFATFACSGELFTGDCLMAIGRAAGIYGGGIMRRNMILAFLGNLFGALGVACIAYLCEIGLDAQAASLAASKVATPPLTLVARGIMCNMLVCAATWMSANGVGKLTSALLPVTVFVALGFEHGVADMFYVLYGSFASDTQDVLGFLADFAPMLALVSVGNVIGGFALSQALYDANS